MDDLSSARAALALAVEDVQRAMRRVRTARDVDWVSVLASRYRDELQGVLNDLARFRDLLDDAGRFLA